MDKQPTCGIILADKSSLCGKDAIAMVAVADPADPTHTVIKHTLYICQDHSDRLFNDGVAFAFRDKEEVVQIQLNPNAQPDTLKVPQS